MSYFSHLLFFLISIMLLSCNNNKNNIQIKKTDTATVSTENPSSNNKYSAQLFLIDSLNKNLGYGYAILVNNTVFINQPCIPSIPGNKAFKNEEDAQKTASLMIYKLEHQIMPPSVSKKELDSLGIN